MTSIGIHVPIYGGLFGGFLVALVLTPFITELMDGPTAPTELFWSKLLGDGPPETFTTQGTVLYLCYGMVGGMVLGSLEPLNPVTWAVTGTIVEGVLTGVANGLIFGFFLFVVALGIFRFALHSSVKRIRFGRLLYFHLAYGAFLGALFGFYLNY